MRGFHSRLNGGRKASVQEDFAMGAVAGAAAAAATTPLDVIKTNMMCAAASRPSMLGAAAAVYATGGPSAFFRGVGTRALSNGINSAVFFCFFEALRNGMADAKRKFEAAEYEKGGSSLSARSDRVTRMTHMRQMKDSGSRMALLEDEATPLTVPVDSSELSN
jgi:hypothetical protein